MPRGGWLREVRRWACCGLRRTGGPSPGLGTFSSSPYTVPLCWVWGPGIAVLWSCQRIDVCDSVRLLYLLTLQKVSKVSDQVIRENPAQHGSVAGAPKNRQRILSVRRSGWSRNAGPQQWY